MSFKEFKFFIINIIIVFIFLMISIFITKRSYNLGYMDCAKDFYKGKMKVDLIENADGTKEWKWIK